MTERLQEILNRKPSKWGNLTVKEFEGDIKLLQERVQELEDALLQCTDHGASVLKQNRRYREYLGRLQRATNRYPAEDMAYVVNKITSEALEGEE